MFEKGVNVEERHGSRVNRASEKKQEQFPREKVTSRRNKTGHPYIYLTLVTALAPSFIFSGLGSRQSFENF